MRDFVRWYDVIYSQKNYNAETKIAINFVNEFGLSPQHILEIGAGTGNHTLQLASLVKQLSVVEMDSDMACLGQRKTRHLKHVHWHLGQIETAANNLYVDASVALFYMLNYIRENQSLKIFLINLNKRMKMEGVFVFDCWNGTHIFAEKVSAATRSFTADDFQVQQQITTTIDSDNKFAELYYDIKVRETKAIHVFNEKILIRLWTITEITNEAENSGFSVQAIRCHNDAKLTADFSTPWLWVVLKKTVEVN